MFGAAVLFIVAVVLYVAGVVTGWYSNSWALKGTECSRCHNVAKFTEIHYRCECGESPVARAL